MTLKSGISDAAFRLKLYTGAAALGGIISAILFPLYLADFPEADLIQTVKIIHHVFRTDPTSSWLMVGCSAALAFWLVWMIVARPWRDGGGPPEAGRPTVKKPW